MDFSVKCRILVLIQHLVAAFRDPCSHPASRIYVLKLSNRNTRARCEICSKLTIKTPFTPRSSVSNVNFEHVIASCVGVSLWHQKRKIITLWLISNRIQCEVKYSSVKIALTEMVIDRKSKFHSYYGSLNLSHRQFVVLALCIMQLLVLI